MPPLTPIENELRTLARGKIEQGRLPATLPVRTWGGSGSGQSCDLCGKLVTSGEIEYEIEEDRDGGKHSYRLHFLCHAAWQFECARAEYLRRTRPDP